MYTHTHIWTYWHVCACACVFAVCRPCGSRVSWECERERERGSQGAPIHAQQANPNDKEQLLLHLQFITAKIDERQEPTHMQIYMHTCIHTYRLFEHSKPFTCTHNTNHMVRVHMMFGRVASRSKTRSKLNELRFHSLEFLLGFCAAAGRGSSLGERGRINNSSEKDAEIIKWFWTSSQNMRTNNKKKSLNLIHSKLQWCRLLDRNGCANGNVCCHAGMSKKLAYNQL